MKTIVRRSESAKDKAARQTKNQNAKQLPLKYPHGAPSYSAPMFKLQRQMTTLLHDEGYDLFCVNGKGNNCLMQSFFHQLTRVQATALQSIQLRNSVADFIESRIPDEAHFPGITTDDIAGMRDDAYLGEYVVIALALKFDVVIQWCQILNGVLRWSNAYSRKYKGVLKDDQLPPYIVRLAFHTTLLAGEAHGHWDSVVPILDGNFDAPADTSEMGSLVRHMSTNMFVFPKIIPPNGPVKNHYEVEKVLKVKTLFEYADGENMFTRVEIFLVKWKQNGRPQWVSESDCRCDILIAQFKARMIVNLPGGLKVDGGEVNEDDEPVEPNVQLPENGHDVNGVERDTHQPPHSDEVEAAIDSEPSEQRLPQNGGMNPHYSDSDDPDDLLPLSALVTCAQQPAPTVKQTTIALNNTNENERQKSIPLVNRTRVNPTPLEGEVHPGERSAVTEENEDIPLDDYQPLLQHPCRLVIVDYQDSESEDDEQQPPPHHDNGPINAAASHHNPNSPNTPAQCVAVANQQCVGGEDGVLAFGLTAAVLHQHNYANLPTKAAVSADILSKRVDLQQRSIPWIEEQATLATSRISGGASGHSGSSSSTRNRPRPKRSTEARKNQKKRAKVKKMQEKLSQEQEEEDLEQSGAE